MDRQIAEAIDREIAWGNAKWPEVKSLGDVLLILEDEVREAKLDYIKGRRAACLTELLQCAAVVVNAIHQHGVRERPEVMSEEEAL